MLAGCLACQVRNRMPLTGGWNGRSHPRPDQGRRRRRRDQHTRGTGDPRPGRYEIDISSSTVTFRTRHLFGLAPVRGSFAIRAGTIDVGEPLARSSAFVQIDAASFRTGNGQRDDQVRSERLLDTERYPAITFRS